MKQDISDIEQLARKYDPDYVKPPTFDLRPAFALTGDLRQDVYNLLVSRREDNLVAMGLTLGVSDYVVSQHVQRFVREGVFTQEQVYAYLPKVREAHERRDRYYARKRQQQLSFAAEFTPFTKPQQ